MSKTDPGYTDEYDCIYIHLAFIFKLLTLQSYREKQGRIIMITEMEEICFIKILQEELVTAMGCTEPIAIAYAAAKAREVLGMLPEAATVNVSGNIIKNVKSVVVPHTGGLCGIEAAAAAGIVAGKADKKLEVISEVTEDEILQIHQFQKEVPIHVEHANTPYLFDIQIRVSGKGHRAFVRIVHTHTNIVEIRRDYELLYFRECGIHPSTQRTDRSFITIDKIVAFANRVTLSKVTEILDRQISYNMKIAEEGLIHNWGANIGAILLASGKSDSETMARAYAAAGSDARMSGCELPVVINSGSGNQGITASVPVIIYAKQENIMPEQLYRALLISNLVTIHLKTGIGTLSAYCGAISAGVGAAAAIAYLNHADYDMIAHTIVNALAINSGVICDGAKPSCAAKIASAVEAGLIGYHMYQHGKQFFGGDGIVKKGVENTIKNIGKLAQDGMAETDKEIIRLMINC